MMPPEENVREQTVTNCKPVFVDIELGFGAFGRCFLIVSQVRKGMELPGTHFFCLSYNSTLFKERNERKQERGVSCFKCTFSFP